MKITYTLLGLTLGIALNTQAQNVGINTDGSNPDGDAILHIKNDAASGKDSSVVRIENAQNGANNVTGVEIYNSGTGATAKWDVYIPASGSTDLRFKNNGTDRITIQNDGDVGIGTTTPVSGLEVNTSIGYKVNTVTSATTLDNSHNVIFCDNGPYTITLPPAATNTGRVYKIKNIDITSEVITIDGDANETIDGETTIDLYPYKNSVTLISDGDNWFIGDNYLDETVPAVSSLSCGSASNNGILASGQAANSVTSEIPYSGGNGGIYSGEAIASTSVTGLTATRNADTLSVGSGSVIYTITGTPSSTGTAEFALSLAGRTCILSREVVAVGTISSINCGGATHNGTLNAGSAASSVTSVIPYTGGNGGVHNGQTVNSTGVTGLTATLSAGVFASGSGNLTYTITGTPNTYGNASFALNIGGRTCTLTRKVLCSLAPTTIVDVTNPTTGRTWMDRNLGATQVAASSTDADSYGGLYQWGRLTDGHECRVSNTTTDLSTTDVPGHGDFILVNASPFDWRNDQNDNLWQGVSGINNPCPNGYRLPTTAEWTDEVNSWGSHPRTGSAFSSVLALPLAGRRELHNGNVANGVGNYWSSTIDGTGARSLGFSNSYGNSGYGSSYWQRGDGMSVRCIRN